MVKDREVPRNSSVFWTPDLQITAKLFPKKNFTPKARNVSKKSEIGWKNLLDTLILTSRFVAIKFLKVVNKKKYAIEQTKTFG